MNCWQCDYFCLDMKEEPCCNCKRSSEFKVWSSAIEKEYKEVCGEDKECL